jgi:hypothetical protein
MSGKFIWRRGNHEKLTEAQARQLFRRLFLSGDGLKVLRLLLNDWHFFDICETEEHRVLNEYAKFFLHRHLGLADLYLASDLVLDETIRKDEQGEDHGRNS